jgi:LysR family transcriptional regulator, low CO2-responsive transcriptional regulator
MPMEQTSRKERSKRQFEARLHRANGKDKIRQASNNIRLLGPAGTCVQYNRPYAQCTMLNLHHLRIFYSVARRMSYTKAAEDLSITQPAVTNQTRAFEEELGLKLFEGKPGRVFLTEEGKALYAYARRLFDLEVEIESAVSDLKGLRAGTVRLGALRMYAPFLHVLINHFHGLYPNIRVKVDEAGSLDLVQSLLDYRNEVAICLQIGEVSDICFIPFCREDLTVVLPVGHPLAGKKEIAVEELAGEKIILRGKGSASRQLVLEWFEKSRVSRKILTEADNSELIKNMIHRGEGISFMAKIAVSKEVDEGRLIAIPLKGNPISLPINIACLKSHVLSPPATVFLKVLETLVPRESPVASVTTLIAALQKPAAGQP